MKKYTHYQSNFPNVFINYSDKDGNFIETNLTTEMKWQFAYLSIPRRYCLKEDTP